MSYGPDNPLTSSEATDEDELQADPLDRGMEPPERWAEADQYGMTPREQREGEPLKQRLAQEEPETTERDIHDAGVLGDNEVIQGQVEELGPRQPGEQ